MLLFLMFMCCVVVTLFYLQISFMFSSYFTNQARRVLPIFQYSQKKTTIKPKAILFLGEMSAVNDVPFEHLKLIQVL